MFILALIPLSLILRKEKAAYEFSESKEKISHLLFMDDLKLFSRKVKKSFEVKTEWWEFSSCS